MLNQKNYILKAHKITAVEIDEIRGNITLDLEEATEDYTNEVNGDRTDANGIKKPEESQRKCKHSKVK